MRWKIDFFRPQIKIKLNDFRSIRTIDIQFFKHWLKDALLQGKRLIFI